MNHQGQSVVAAYIVSVDTDGHVTKLESITKEADIDAVVMPVLMQWKFHPIALPVRTVLRFEFNIPVGHSR